MTFLLSYIVIAVVVFLAFLAGCVAEDPLYTLGEALVMLTVSVLVGLLWPVTVPASIYFLAKNG